MVKNRFGINVCRNLNHGRMNVSIGFCPECGESFGPKNAAACNTQRHAALRKQRFVFCMDCGTKLNK